MHLLSRRIYFEQHFATLMLVIFNFPPMSLGLHVIILEFDIKPLLFGISLCIIIPYHDIITMYLECILFIYASPRYI
jgi:hypothetical protein